MFIQMLALSYRKMHIEKKLSKNFHRRVDTMFLTVPNKLSMTRNNIFPMENFLSCFHVTI